MRTVNLWTSALSACRSEPVENPRGPSRSGRAAIPTIARSPTWTAGLRGLCVHRRDRAGPPTTVEGSAQAANLPRGPAPRPPGRHVLGMARDPSPSTHDLGLAQPPLVEQPTVRLGDLAPRPSCPSSPPGPRRAPPAASTTPAAAPAGPRAREVTTSKRSWPCSSSARPRTTAHPWPGRGRRPPRPGRWSAAAAAPPASPSGPGGRWRAPVRAARHRTRCPRPSHRPGSPRQAPRSSAGGGPTAAVASRGPIRPRTMPAVASQSAYASASGSRSTRKPPAPQRARGVLFHVKRTASIRLRRARITT